MLTRSLPSDELLISNHTDQCRRAGLRVLLRVERLMSAESAGSDTECYFRRVQLELEDGDIVISWVSSWGR